MRARRTVKERDIVKILVFGYDRTLIKSIKGFRIQKYVGCNIVRQ
jgi:hypothetical protein